MRPTWHLAVGLLLCAACEREPETPALARSSVTPVAGKIAVEARVLDESGAPLAERDLAVFIAASGLVPPRLDPFVGSARTDEEGRVMLAAPASMARHTLQLVLTLEGDPERRFWTGSAPTETGKALVSVGDVTLRPPSTQLPPDRIRELDDDELERRLLRSFALWFRENTFESNELEWLLREAGLREGERWLKFLRAAKEEVSRRTDRPQDEHGWIPTLSALRLVEGRPLFAKVIVHPEDCDGRPRHVLQSIRYEVMNLDSTEWISPTDSPASVLFEVTDLEGRPAERRAWPIPSPTLVWSNEVTAIPPGSTSRHVLESDWWTEDLSAQFVLGPGDWIVRLRAAADGSIYGTSGIVYCPVLDSDPFIVRIHPK